MALAGALAIALLLPPASAAARKNPSPSTSRRSQHPTRKASAQPHSSKQHSGKRSRRVRRARGQRTPEPARIQEIQQALIDRGFLAPPTTGRWDSTTSEAMRRFQRENGLEETGKFDARSLIKLGLGPPTAGVAAPRDVASNPGNHSNTKP